MRYAQDHEREDALISLFQLRPSGKRTGADAYDEYENEYELKSTTRDSVCTYRDLGLNHIEKWRKQFWIFSRGFYKKNYFTFTDIYFVPPDNMELWYSQIEAILLERQEIANQVMKAVGNFPPKKIKAVQDALQKGFTLSNPHIPWEFVVKNGIRIDDDHAKTLRNLVGNKKRLIIPKIKKGIATLEKLLT